MTAVEGTKGSVVISAVAVSAAAAAVPAAAAAAAAAAPGQAAVQPAAASLQAYLALPVLVLCHAKCKLIPEV